MTTSSIVKHLKYKNTAQRHVQTSTNTDILRANTYFMTHEFTKMNAKYR